MASTPPRPRPVPNARCAAGGYYSYPGYGYSSYRYPSTVVSFY